MKNEKNIIKNGFTLIELLSVIVLIGILFTIGLFSVSSIRKTILEKQYKNILTNIKLSAQNYYNDTKSTSFYVQTLIDEGYIKADNNKGFIYNPKNNESLNCQKITYDEEKDTINIDITDNPVCNYDNEEVYDISINIKGTNNEEKWYNTSLTLEAISKKEINMYVWTSDLNPNTIFTEKNFPLSSLLNERGGIINDTFYVTGSYDNNYYKSNGKKIMIDTVKPKITGIEIENEENYSSEKNIIISAKDDGSGVSYYAVINNGINSCQDVTNWERVKASTNAKINYVAKENGKYYICIKDGAGNIIDDNENNTFEITTIDNIKPVCSYIGNNTWKNLASLSYGCEDNESGCKSVEIDPINKVTCNENCTYLYLHMDYNNSGKIMKAKDLFNTFTITDKAGNKTICPLESDNVNVYVDNEKPIITSLSIKSRDSRYNSKYANISFTISDILSGLGSYCISENSTYCNNYINVDEKTKDSNGNYNITLEYTFSSSDGSGASYEIYLFVKDKVGNIAKQSVRYTLYSSCTVKTYSHTYTGSCSASCGNGYRSVTDYYTDSYLGTSCNSSYSSSCYAGSCQTDDSPSRPGGGSSSGCRVSGSSGCGKYLTSQGGICCTKGCCK